MWVSNGKRLNWFQTCSESLGWPAARLWQVNWHHLAQPWSIWPRHAGDARSFESCHAATPHHSAPEGFRVRFYAFGYVHGAWSCSFWRRRQAITSTQAWALSMPFHSQCFQTVTHTVVICFDMFCKFMHIWSYLIVFVLKYFFVLK